VHQKPVKQEDVPEDPRRSPSTDELVLDKDNAPSPTVPVRKTRPQHRSAGEVVLRLLGGLYERRTLKFGFNYSDLQVLFKFPFGSRGGQGDWFRPLRQSDSVVSLGLQSRAWYCPKRRFELPYLRLCRGKASSPTV
jgi:hypothetical protein